jgi:tetratricopeptide (TPR) repeat protein
MHPDEVTEAAILPWIPRAAEVDQEKDKGLMSFAKILAENCSIHNAATWILQNQPWDFMAVYYNGIDHFCHGFMHYHPPRMEGIPEDRFEIYKDVVNGAYRFHDMMLQTLLDLAGPDTTVLLVSDHGFHSDHLRPRGIPAEPAGPAVQHRPFGIFCMKGPHIQQDERIYGATLLDVTPTILTLFGLPVGSDMDGRVLVQAFEEPPQIARIPSWEQELGECGMHPSDLRMDPAAAQAVLQQFVALGYIQPPSEDQSKAVAGAVREANYNLARDYLDCGRPDDALPLLEDLVKNDPKQTRFQMHLAQCYLALSRREAAKQILEGLITADLNPPQAGNAKGESGEEPKPSGAAPETEAAPIEARQAAPPDPSPPGVPAPAAATPPDKQPNSRPWADLLMGVIHFEEGNMEAALASLLKAEQSDPRLPNLHLRIGETYLRQKRADDASRAFQQALDIDGDSPEAHLGLAMVGLRQRRNGEAAEQALLAVGLQHFLPLGHFYLGVALARLGHRQRAMLAFETCLSMLPGLVAAHRCLAQSLRSIHAAEKDESASVITIVSGLPRSGTSLMMQMLAAGGMPVLTDGERHADSDNPRGYFEWERIKLLPQQPDCIAEAEDKVVKVISQLLFALPPGHDYRIIFVQRPLPEVVASQAEMIRRRGTTGAALPPAALIAGLGAHLNQVNAWLKNKANISLCRVEHHDLLREPLRTSESIQQFLNCPLDVAAMSQQIDLSLYRQRATPAS